MQDVHAFIELRFDRGTSAYAISNGAGLIGHRGIEFENTCVHVVDEGRRHLMSDELRGQRNGVSRKRARGGDQNFVVLLPCGSIRHCPKRCWYSLEVMKALTISAFWKLPLN